MRGAPSIKLDADDVRRDDPLRRTPPEDSGDELALAAAWIEHAIVGPREPDGKKPGDHLIDHRLRGGDETTHISF